jgi:hypothetical protein
VPLVRRGGSPRWLIPADNVEVVDADVDFDLWAGALEMPPLLRLGHLLLLLPLLLTAQAGDPDRE